jgi:hypothetical protein
MMSKTKVFVFSGAIASCKTYLAMMMGGQQDDRKVLLEHLPQFFYRPGVVFQVNFDKMVHVDAIPPADNDERTIERIMTLINKEYVKNNYKEPIVIDGWFSFIPDWWTSPEQELSLSLLQRKLGHHYEVIPMVVFRQKDEIMKEIESNNLKHRYSGYKEQLENIYMFLTNHIWRWYRGQS